MQLNKLGSFHIPTAVMKAPQKVSVTTSFKLKIIEKAINLAAGKLFQKIANQLILMADPNMQSPFLTAYKRELWCLQQLNISMI